MSEGAAVSKRRRAFVVVPDDSEKYVPTEYVGHPIAPNHYCRRWNQKRQKYCRQRAGYATDHPGVGRCRRHDGGSDKQKRHGLRSIYRLGNRTMLEAVERIEVSPALLDMRSELVILCALLDEALAKEEIDRAVVERLAVEANRMKERIHNTSAKNAFSVEQMKNLWLRQVRVIQADLADHPDLRNKLLQHLSQVGP